MVVSQSGSTLSEAARRMAGEFTLRVWNPGLQEPSTEKTILGAALPLDRTLLGVHDASVSRTPNAPKLRPLSAAELELEVPERSARRVLVFEGLRFDVLQTAVPPPRVAWKIEPGQLGRAGRLVCGRAASLALVRRIEWDQAGPTHHVILLPKALFVAPGEKARLATPAPLLIGDAALDATPNDTQVPMTIPSHGERTSSFRLGDVEKVLEPLDRLDGFPSGQPHGRLRLPDSNDDLDPDDILPVVNGFLERSQREHLFFPVLEDQRRPRLGLGYQRRDGSVGAIVGSVDPERFLEELAAYLKGGAPRTSASILPVSQVKIPTQSTEARPVVTRFGSAETRNLRFGAVLQRLANVADSDLGVLLLGESGTGKEHLAKELHAASPRRRGPFVAINCSAISDDLIESELFGHRKGAFTGAQADRGGAFSAADGGTLLLDEIGDAPLRVQVALLRALESRRIKPVGADHEREIDVRVLGATSCPVRSLIEAGRFREDLYYRLAELTVELPPLRDRREDIPALADRLLANLREGVTISRQAEALLLQHDWPGNVRELRNALKRAVALSRGTGVLQAVHFAPLGPSENPGEAAGGIVFPAHVMIQAERLWRDGELASGDAGTRYEQRALVRACMLYIAATTPVVAWPKALSQHWHRLFGERWATSEDGRGLRELVKELGMDPKDEGARARVGEAVARA
ncbi:MAG TPA: sigma-54 dependent transcriptional regulator [Polyangiaceae bacterium]